MFDDAWDEWIRVGPFGFGFAGGSRSIRYGRTETSHVLRVRIDPEIRKDEIRARLVKPGLLEIEWPRSKGEEIPIE